MLVELDGIAFLWLVGQLLDVRHSRRFEALQ